MRPGSSLRCLLPSIFHLLQTKYSCHNVFKEAFTNDYIKRCSKIIFCNSSVPLNKDKEKNRDRRKPFKTINTNYPELTENMLTSEQPGHNHSLRPNHPEGDWSPPRHYYIGKTELVLFLLIHRPYTR